MSRPYPLLPESVLRSPRRGLRFIFGGVRNGSKPLGVYDRDRIQGTIVLREGTDGESYDGVGNRPVNLAGRFLLADDAGPFGSPITDSRRTSITERTTNAVVLIYAPATYEESALASHARTFADRVETCCGGRTSGITLKAG